MAPGSPRTGIRRGAVLGLQVLSVCCLAVGIWLYLDLLVARPIWHHTFDLRVYRGAVQWWLDDRPLYAFLRPHTQKGFTYPPFAVLCLLPLALGTETTATVLLTAVSGVLIGLTTWGLVAPVAARHGWSRWWAVGVAVPLVCAMEPIRETLGWGQIDLVIAALVLADVPALARNRPWAGVGIGLATAIKLTPGLFVVHLAVTRRWRAAGVAAGTFLGATLLAGAIDPSASVRYWTATLWRTDRVGPPVDPNNQSILGVLARLAAPRAASAGLWLALAGAVLVVGLWRAARLHRRGDDLAGVVVTGLTACLISPISWVHHLYWVVPAAAVLVDVAAGTPVVPGTRWAQRHPRAVRRAAAAAALVVVGVFATSTIWFFPHETGVGAAVGENAYALLMLALVLGLPARAVTSSASGPTHPVDRVRA